MKKTFVSEYTANGYCYKNLDAFLNHRDEVCYIAESEFSDGNGDIIVVEEDDMQFMIKCHSFYTHNSICAAIVETLNNCKIPVIDNFVEYIARCAFDECDWQYIHTWLFEFEQSADDDYAEWCEGRKYQFELYAVNNVRDEGSGELLDEAYHNELFERLYECLGADCYLYDEPKVLIDRWEN